MRFRPAPLPLFVLLAGTGLLAPGAAAPVHRPAVGSLPPIVFVSRSFAPDTGVDPADAIESAGGVPGFGPHGRAARAPGRLMSRAADGTVRELAGTDRFSAIAHPRVSPDGKCVAFAAAEAPTDPWRLWRYDLDTARLQPLAPDPWFVDIAGDAHTRGDLVQPCWISDSVLCAVWLQPDRRTQYTDLPVSSLVMFPSLRGTQDDERPRHLRSGPGVSATDGVFFAAKLTPITHERNGAEAPAFDPVTGRIVYSRWWFNRWRASDDDPRGITDDVARAIARDTVNLWQIVSIRPDGTDERVEASGMRSRLESMGYGPAVLADGSIVATYASNLGLSPRPGSLGIQRFSPRLGHAERLVGAIVDAKGGSDYGSPRGLAAPAACDPAGLPGGRLLFSYAPGGRGDFGLYVMDRDGSHVGKVFDAEGSDELDAAPIVTWRGMRDAELPPAPPAPVWQPDGLATGPTFRFFDRDVFAGGHAMPGVHAAPPRSGGARIRFWAALPRPTVAGGDTAVLVREVPVRPDGSVDERVPAGVPMFEQLVDSNGRVLRTPEGPAHVAGLNTGPPGGTVTCVGCHTGHSVLERGRIHPPRR